MLVKELHLFERAEFVNRLKMTKSNFRQNAHFQVNNTVGYRNGL